MISLDTTYLEYISSDSSASSDLATDEYINCKSVKALNKLKKILQVSRLNDQDYILDHLPTYMTNFILLEDINLVDILSRKWKKRDGKVRKIFRDIVGEILLDKLTTVKGSYSKYCAWYHLDKCKAQIIIASCLNKYGEVDDILFRDRFDSRIKSSIKLTEKCRY